MVKEYFAKNNKSATGPIKITAALINESDLNRQFSEPLLYWFDAHGRKNLPWQHPRSAYRVWIAEIMLQQTQVLTVIPYFETFLRHFPTISQLALADEDEVLACWSGLGYYSRARNLHKTAKIIYQDFAGIIPDKIEILVDLPGIGLSTAAAITAQAFDQRTAILDANVKRVLARYFMVDGLPEQGQVKKRLWQLANQCMPTTRARDYTQAIMDLGATCCKNKSPTCHICPLQKTCLAFLNSKVMSYPFKKIKKKLAVKEQQFLILHTAQQQIFLEKRPPLGIWGGLWCMPVVETSCNVANHVAEYYGFQSNKIYNLTRIKHNFSHFQLYINAQAVQIDQIPNCYVAEKKGEWFSGIDIAKLGLAKPVKQIIELFFKQRQDK